MFLASKINELGDKTSYTKVITYLGEVNFHKIERNEQTFGTIQHVFLW